jgi:hypothetical protein
MNRECDRYGLDRERVAAILQGDDPLAREMTTGRRWWELLIVAAAVGIFLWLAFVAELQPISVSLPWMALLSVASLVFLALCGALLWKRTRFS